MPEPLSTSAAQVTVKMYEGKWAMNCSCGTSRVGFADSGAATRAGATHLYRAHGIYAGGHKPTMGASGDDA